MRENRSPREVANAVGNLAEMLTSMADIIADHLQLQKVNPQQGPGL